MFRSLLSEQKLRSHLPQTRGGILEPSRVFATVHVAVHRRLELDPRRQDAVEGARVVTKDREGSRRFVP